MTGVEMTGEIMKLITSGFVASGTILTTFKILGVRLLDWIMAPALITYIIRVVIPWLDSIKAAEDPNQLRLPSGVRP